MNVLNVEDAEYQLRRTAAQALHPEIENWVMTVARNYLLGNLPEPEIDANYRDVAFSHQGGLWEHQDPASLHVISKHQLPAWATESAEAAARDSADLKWFDSVQVSRRKFWTELASVLLWFNSWKADDHRLKRITRISFTAAAKAAEAWYTEISTNIWKYVKDTAPVIMTFDTGVRWVQLLAVLHFERESNQLGHCVHNGNYQRNSERGTHGYYSLRDAKNESRCTIEVKFNTSAPHDLIQCKGASNSKPADQWQPYIAAFIAKTGLNIAADKHHINTAHLDSPMQDKLACPSITLTCGRTMAGAVWPFDGSLEEANDGD